MKYLISCLLLVLTLNLSSQSVKEIKVSKSKIEASKTLHDLISDIPKDCTVSSFVFSGGLNGNLKEFRCSGPSLAPEIKVIVSAMENKKVFFIEEIRSTCQKSHKAAYKIILE